MDLDWKSVGVAVGVIGFLTIWWRTGTLISELRRVRLQLNRLSMSPLTLEDHERVDQDGDLLELTPDDLKAIEASKHARWRHENPEEWQRILDHAKGTEPKALPTQLPAKNA